MLNLLIIDEDQSACHVLKESFDRLGCQTTIISTAEEGIEMLKKAEFHAVFAALSARINGGRSVARWIKENASETHCFITTSWKGELESELVQMDGISQVLHKPLTYNQIKSSLGEFFPIPETSKLKIPVKDDL